MKINFIKNEYTKDVELKEESDALLMCPNLPKEKLPMINYWNVASRSGLPEDAEIKRLMLDYDSGVSRKEVETRFSKFNFISYSSTGNTKQHEKFRLILFLKEPVDAYSLRHWRNTAKFKNIFKDVDFSCFAVGRFFFIPSKYDKDGIETNVIVHKGELGGFDFYKEFPKVTKCEAFDKVVSMMKRNHLSHCEEPKIDVLQRWADTRRGFHYMDAFGFCIFAQRLCVDEDTAFNIFMSHYEGNTDMKKYWDRIWDNAENA